VSLGSQVTALGKAGKISAAGFSAIRIDIANILV
jgi:hypothetical protein